MSTHDRWPASPGQVNLWLEEASNRGGRSNINVALLKIEGPITGDAISRALVELLTAHPAMHTRFEEADGVLYQCLGGVVPPTILSHDYSSCHPKTAVRRALLTARTVADAPLDPAAGNVFRAAVLCATPDLHFVVLAASMLVSDGASMAALYREFLLKLPSSTTTIERKDAVAALRAAGVVDQAAFEVSLRFWQKRLEGRTLKYPWPVAQSLSAASLSDGFIVRHECSLADSRALDTLAERRAATRYAVVAAAIAVVLQRIVGWTEIPFVLPMDGRNVANAGVVGHFLRIAPCVIRIDPDADFAAAIDATAAALVEGGQHRCVNLYKLLGVIRSSGQSGVGASVMIAQNNAPAHKVQIGAVSVAPLRLHNHSSKFDWSALVGQGEPITVESTFRKSLFSAAAADSWMAQVAHVLAEAARGSRAPVGSMLPPNARVPAALEDDEHADDPPRLSLPDLIGRVAMDRPDADALVVGGVRISYGELGARIARASARLAQHGLRRGEPVLIAAGRGLASYVGFLAVIASGGIATPFDPSWPAFRRELVRQSVGARFVCGDVDLVPERSWMESIDLEGPDSAAPPAGVGPLRLDDPAYIIFTSGTTGRAKPVVGTHRALANLAATATEFDLGPGWQVGQYASLWVDASLWDICATLSSGATLVVLSDRSRLGPRALQATIDRERLDLLKVPPSILAAFDQNRAVPRVTILAGEECPLSVWKAWAQQTRLFNAYGPTEAGVWASLESLPADGRLIITVGRPIRGAAISVRDPAGRLVPRGAWGEVWIAGQGLALGYHNDAGQTTMDYRELADSNGGKRRWYRTGDRGRMLFDGRLQLAGRFDRMFKLNGQRIHPEEVESCIREASPSVINAVVVGVPVSAPKRMVALVESVQLSESDIKQLIGSSLRRTLPVGLANPQIRIVGDLPKTAGGKIDMATARRLAEQSSERNEHENGDAGFFYRLSYAPDGYLPLSLQPRKPWMFVGFDLTLPRELERAVADHGLTTAVALLEELADPKASAFPSGVGQVILALDFPETADNVEELLRRLHRGLTSLALRLCAPGQRAIELWIVLNRLFRIGPDDPISPPARLPLAWLKAAAVELPEVRVKLLDFGPPGHRPSSVDEWRIALGSLIELPSGSIRAFRSGTIYSRRLSAAAVPATDREPQLESSALFFGGGDIAQAFACRMVKPGATVVFASRRAKSPERGPLEAQRVSELSRLGVKAKFVRCDLGEAADVARVLKGFVGAFGQSVLVGHFAADAVGKSVLTTSEEDALDQYRTKAKGLSTILTLTSAHCPQARVFAMSSSATFGGGFGSYAYAFGNMMLEAIADQAQCEVQVIATGRWRSIGMAARLASSGRVSDEFAKTLRTGFDVEDGCKALRTALSVREPLVFISAHPLPPTEPSDYFVADVSSAAGIVAPEPMRPRKADALDAYVAPRTPLEAWLAKRFENCLSVSPVGIRDDFFALGGHSLYAVNLADMISSDFGVQIGLAAVFRAPSVEDMARFLTEASAQSHSIHQLAATLLHLSALPDDVVEKLEQKAGLE
ncbi:amino acid adenylation domain-containing protein [Rhodospirillales bacterium URHD0017]|nr:amino acid adenylation domain-containing protein [Rhodospirillales bacterium URHD0017]